MEDETLAKESQPCQRDLQRKGSQGQAVPGSLGVSLLAGTSSGPSGGCGELRLDRRSSERRGIGMKPGFPGEALTGSAEHNIFQL